MTNPIQTAASRPLFRPALILALVLLSAFSFSAYFALSAFGADLKERNDGGRHGWSKSAIGYRALSNLLDAEGVQTILSRNTEFDRNPDDWVLLTPNIHNSRRQVQDMLHGHILLVLPKWTVVSNRAKQNQSILLGMTNYKTLEAQAERWLSKTNPDKTTKAPKDKPVIKLKTDEETPAVQVLRTITPISDHRAKTIESRQEALNRLREMAKTTPKKKGRKAKADTDKPTKTDPLAAKSDDPYFEPDGSPRAPQAVWDRMVNATLLPVHHWQVQGLLRDMDFNPGPIQNLQVVEWDQLEPVISDGGAILLGRLRGTPKGSDIYVLSDPDLLNNMGILSSRETMRAGIGIINGLTTRNAAVVMDLTLHGFGKNVNILKTLLTPPFLGVSLCALAVTFLMAWSAWNRFGNARAGARPFAAGNRELVENSASLIRLARRETGMMPGFLDMTRDMAAKDVGAPRTLSRDDLDALLNRMAHNAGARENFMDLKLRAQALDLRQDEILEISRKLVQWRMELKQ